MTSPPGSDQPEYNSFFFLPPSPSPFATHHTLYNIQGTRTSDIQTNFSVHLCLRLDKLHYITWKREAWEKCVGWNFLYFFQTSSEWPSRSQNFFPLKWETFSLLVNCDSVIVSLIWNRPVNLHECYMWYKSLLGQQ